MNSTKSILMCVVLCFSLLFTVQTQASSKYVIEPKFDSVQNFSEGLAAVFIDEHWGYVDKSGKEIISPQFDLALPFNEGLAAVAYEGLWGFIDQTGHFVIPAKFEMVDMQPDYVGGFSEGLAAISLHDQWGFVDQKGNIVIEPQFDYALSFSDGLAAVLKDDSWGYIDKAGNMVIDPIYELAQSFHEGAAAVYYFGGWGFIHKNGEAFTGFIYSEPSSFRDGLAPVDDGFIDLDGILVINFLEEHFYDKADSFYNDVAMVYKIMQREFYYGFMDRDGKEIIAPQFPIMRQVQFSEGLGAIYEDNLWGFIDRAGNRVTEPQFEDISGDYREGLVGVLINGKWGFIGNPLSSGSGQTNEETPSVWAVEEVEAAKKLNLVPKHMDNRYTTHMNRQQFSELIVNLFSSAEGKTIEQWMAEIEEKLPKSVFQDTNDPMVLAAYDLGIVNGKGMGIFDPQGEITRQEAAVMLQRAALKLNMTVSPITTPYADQQTIADWALDGIMFVAALDDETVGKAVMSGMDGNRFVPSGKYTREQAFITIKRLYHALNN